MSNKVILVLGMHRSATSLTTNILTELGLYAGSKDELLEADSDNKKGYFERKDVIELSDKMLVENGMTWTSVRRQIKNIEIKEDTQKKLEEILINMEKNASGRNMVIKAPRICITEPVWRKAIVSLGMKERAVAVFRHPYEVAMSINKRDGIDFSYALKMWYYYNCCILNSLSSLDNTDYILINHNDYFYKSGLQIDKITKFLQIDNYNETIIKDIVDLKLYHNKIDSLFGKGNNLESMANELYNYMVELSDGTKKLDINETGKYISYLEQLDSSFEINKPGIEPGLTEESNYCQVKERCYYILDNYKDTIKKSFAGYFIEKNINSISVYGNGTIAYMLFPLLQDSGIRINKVYDRTNFEPVNYCGSTIEITNIEGAQNNTEEIIINTVVNKHKEITDMLCNYFDRQKIISLFRILYEMLSTSQE